MTAFINDLSRLPLQYGVEIYSPGCQVVTKELILELAQGLRFEFAQFPSYHFGMLGIADTLLDVYQVYSKDEYLVFVEKLLIKASFFLKYNRISVSDFYPVWQRYMEVAI